MPETYEEQAKSYNSLIDEVTTDVMRVLSEAGFGCRSHAVVVDRYRHDSVVTVVKGKKTVPISIYLHINRLVKQIRVIIGMDRLSFPAGRKKFSIDKLLEWVILRVTEVMKSKETMQ